VTVIENRKNANEAGTALMPSLLAPKYANLSTSGLTATIKSGTTPLTFKVERAKK
jgi:hypothetical protein